MTKTKVSMNFSRYCVTKTLWCRKYLLADAVINRNVSLLRKYCAITTGFYKHNIYYGIHKEHIGIQNLQFQHRKWFSSNLFDNLSEAERTEKEQDLIRISKIFPNPRVTLYELSTRQPDKTFEVHYKQAMIAPKGVRKKHINTDWTCTYAFVWPELVKFEGTAKSKTQAADKAANLAVHYLYMNNRIDKKGNPIYDKQVIQELKSGLNEPLCAEISDKSMERLDKLWSEYENEIKEIYEKTFKEAQRKLIIPTAVLQDSTIDKEDDFAEEENFNENPEPEVQTSVHPVYGIPLKKPPTEAMIEKRSKVLKQKFERFSEEQTPLPVDEFAKEITSAISANRACVIVGAAGCGKSTRVPQALLRGGGGAVAAMVAEPRRVAAIGLAQRVASEIGENVGETVGYQIRLKSKPPRPPCGSILYCTSGILLKRLQADPGLRGCTHVFIDEAHERDVNTDLTLLLLKKALNVNPELKVIIMSATLDTDVFTRYFESCPIISVPGRTFPVEVLYLDDIQKRFNLRLPVAAENSQKDDGRPIINCDEIVAVIKAVDRTQPEGAILVFLPGWSDIKTVKQTLENVYPSSTHIILPVHSRLSTEDQTKMFTSPLPGVRKIVIATNIAETSITIPDVVYVIDAGTNKENTYRERTGTSSLQTVWAARAAATQRAGRAGRVRAGICYRLYTKDKEEQLAPHSTPEILRVPLEQVVLECKVYAPDMRVAEFLSQLPDPPTTAAIQSAVHDLIDLGALSPCEQLTGLGWQLCSLGAPPRLAAAALRGASSGVAGPAAAIVAQQATINIFVDSLDRKEEIREIKRNYHPTSDYIALNNIQDDFEQHKMDGGWSNVNEFCKRLGVKKDQLLFAKTMTSILLQQIIKSGVIEPNATAEELNQFADIDEIVTAIFLAGTNSLLRTKKVLKKRGKLATTMELFTSNGDRAHIGSESVNHGITKLNLPLLLSYYHGVHSTERRALVVHRCNVVTVHEALMFAKGRLEKNAVNENTTILSLPRHKLEIEVPSSQADYFIKAKEMIWNTFQYSIERNLKEIEYDEFTTVSRFKVKLFKAIGRILVEAYKDTIESKIKYQNGKIIVNK